MIHCGITVSNSRFLSPQQKSIPFWCCLTHTCMGGRCFLPEPVDEDLGARILHGEDMARGEPAGQVLRGQSKEGVVHGQDA